MKGLLALFLLLAGFAYYLGYRDGVSRSGWNYHEGFSDGMRLGPLEAERKAKVEGYQK